MDPAEGELARRREAVAAGATDLTRWLDETQYEAGWQARAGRALELAKGSRWVCDIGCGPQFLRRLLPPSSVYLPADLRRWTPDTAEIELNAGRLPVTYLELSDVCFLLGVLEYLLDLEKFLRALSARVELVVFSYNPAELVPDDRAAMGWLNALTTSQRGRRSVEPGCGWSTSNRSEIPRSSGARAAGAPVSPGPSCRSGGRCS